MDPLGAARPARPKSGGDKSVLWRPGPPRDLGNGRGERPPPPLPPPFGQSTLTHVRCLVGGASGVIFTNFAPLKSNLSRQTTAANSRRTTRTVGATVDAAAATRKRRWTRLIPTDKFEFQRGGPLKIYEQPLWSVLGANLRARPRTMRLVVVVVVVASVVVIAVVVVLSLAATRHHRHFRRLRPV